MSPRDAPRDDGRRLPRIELVREVTDRAVLDLLVERGPTARAEIARRTGISKPTVTVAVNRLCDAGLVEVHGTGRSEGRPADQYAIAKSAGFVLAVSLEPDQLSLRAVDLRGEVLAEREVDVGGDEPAALLRPLVRDALRSLARRRTDTGPLRALSLSVASPVDELRGRLVPLPDLPSADDQLDPVREVSGLVDAPVLVDNDVNLAALAERDAGAAFGLDSFVLVYVGVGLGAALVLGGTVLRGARGLAGELGYVAVTNPSSEPRPHSLAAALAAAGLGEPGDYRLDVAKAVAALSTNGSSELPNAVLDRAGLVLGGAVTSLCALVDPAVVVLAGPIGGLPPLVERVGQVVADLAPAPVPVVASALPPRPALDGALIAALRRARADLLRSSA